MGKTVLPMALVLGLVAFTGCSRVKTYPSGMKSINLNHGGTLGFYPAISEEEAEKAADFLNRNLDRGIAGQSFLFNRFADGKTNRKGYGLIVLTDPEVHAKYRESVRTTYRLLADKMSRAAFAGEPIWIVFMDFDFKKVIDLVDP